MAQEVVETTGTTEAPPRRQKYSRFNASERFEHMILIVSFTALVITGIPQRYAEYAWAQTMIDVMGGIESVRIVHRIMAVMLIAASIYHGGVVTYRIFVLGRRPSMLPTIKDGRDVFSWIGFNLGITKKHPNMPRYNFGEKVEYLALVWGTLVMIATGFILWNPIAASTVLPGEVIPASRAAHSAEALLAMLSIIIWHFYNVHVRHFNRSMFTGKMSREMMKEEHGEELQEIEEGADVPQFEPEKLERRRRLFWPYAMVMTTVLVGGLVYFVTLEQTAITTINPDRGLPVEEITVSADSGLPERGALLYIEQECGQCHGDRGQGAEGPLNVPIVGTGLTYEEFGVAMRSGPADMKAYPPSLIPDQGIADIWSWLQTLEAPVSASQDSG